MTNLYLKFNKLVTSPPGLYNTINARLIVSENQIRHHRDSNIIVFKSKFEGWPIAVKQLARTSDDTDLKKIKFKILVDGHANIMRWHGVEQDQTYVYLALERCSYKLSDL